MDSPDMIPDSQPESSEPPAPRIPSDSAEDEVIAKSDLAEDYAKLEDEVIANFQKPNLPNVNVPEHIIICLDVCYDEASSLYRLGDGTSFTALNMLKRVLDFFIHSKHAINKKTQFALLILKDSEPFWVHDFTNNLKDIINAVDCLSPEESTSETFDFKEVFTILQNSIEVPDYKQRECILPPPYIVRMIVLYGRSNCVPQIPTYDDFFAILKKEMYFYIDILLAHEDECALYKCEEIYDALQDLDNGYSYVYEVPRNATKIHDCIAKLLAHPLQRPLQKHTEYAFGSCRNRQ